MKNDSLQILECSFIEILPFWENQLWPNRQSKIEKTSAICFGGGYDMNYMSSTPIFARCVSEGNTVGVISGHPTGEEQFRMRGVWVHPDHRALGIGSRLFKWVEDQAKTKGFQYIWTMGRNTSLDFYLKQNLRVSGTSEEFEFGPHYWLIKEL